MPLNYIITKIPLNNHTMVSLTGHKIDNEMEKGTSSSKKSDNLADFS